MQKSPEFQDLRSKFRGFAFPMSVAFFVWYIAYVVVATFLPDVMAIEPIPGFNIGIILGLAQFVTTFLITAIYIRFANKNLEPRQTAIREAMEG
ncbi:DUF485 domain-containing protein [Corynebacterium halotolerans]|uniref:DUF485 domain-containing protein n=1 Tax=Corynebacterium halotolerans TaxID=225326 RepID=UPI003CEC4135